MNTRRKAGAFVGKVCGLQKFVGCKSSWITKPWDWGKRPSERKADDKLEGLAEGGLPGRKKEKEKDTLCLPEAPTHRLEQALRDLERAYKNVFEG